MQKTGKHRNTIDKFYTNKNVVDKFIDKFKPYINQGDLIIEPMQVAAFGHYHYICIILLLLIYNPKVKVFNK